MTESFRVNLDNYESKSVLLFHLFVFQKPLTLLGPCLWIHWPLDSWGAHLRRMFKRPQILESSCTLKSTKIINLGGLFFVISSHFLMFDYIFFPSRKIIIYILAPPLPLWSSSSELSERLSPRLWIKLNSLPLYCVFFFQLTPGRWCWDRRGMFVKLQMWRSKGDFTFTFKIIS